MFSSSTEWVARAGEGHGGREEGSRPLKRRYAITGMVLSLLIGALIALHDVGLFRRSARWICGFAASEGFISARAQEAWWCGGKPRRHPDSVRQQIRQRQR